MTDLERKVFDIILASWVNDGNGVEMSTKIVAMIREALQEPTPGMVKAAHSEWRKKQDRRIALTGGGGEIADRGWESHYWKAMLAASPLGETDE